MAKQSFIHTELSGKVGIFGVLLTIVGTIIGGGIVGIPYATLKTGIWLMLGLHLLNFGFDVVLGFYVTNALSFVVAEAKVIYSASFPLFDFILMTFPLFDNFISRCV